MPVADRLWDEDNRSQAKILGCDLPWRGGPGVFAVATGCFEFDDFTPPDRSAGANAGYVHRGGTGTRWGFGQR